MQHKNEHWLLAEAKNRFSEVARSVFTKGPQKILRREGNVVVISESEYLELKGNSVDFKDFLLQSTPDLSDLDLRRDSSSMREFVL